jgi:hypothetical protein
LSPREREDRARDEGGALCDGGGAVGFTLALGVVASLKIQRRFAL